MSDKGPLVVGFTIFTLALGGAFIAARIITCTLIKPSPGIADAAIVLTWFIILAYNVCYFVAVSHGFGKHTNQLTDADIIATGRCSAFGEMFAAFAFPPGKAAIAFLLLRIFPGKKLKWMLWTTVIINAVFFYAGALLLLLQCQPVAYQWDKTIKGGVCWSPTAIPDLGYFTGAVGAITDFAFAIVPWFYIVKLQMPRKKKIALGAALSATLVPGFCSVVKIWAIRALVNGPDAIYDTVPLVIASEAELFAINVAACIPTLHPLYKWVTGKVFRKNYTTFVDEVPEYGPRSTLFSRAMRDTQRKDDSVTQLSSFYEYHNHVRAC